jgi:hypothetical protein
MKSLVLALAVIFLLLPISQSFAQLTETPSALGVKMTSTGLFSYKDGDGYTVVIGEIENTKTFPVTNVKIWVGFYSGTASGSSGEAPLETTTGSTLLEVVPAKGKSPFMIKSKTPDPNISEVTVNVLGFNSAPQKQQVLQIIPDTLTIGNTIKMSAEIKNGGQQESTKTNIHLIAFDAFKPPRIVGIDTITVDEITQGQSTTIKFDSLMDYRATAFKVVAESDNYQSKIIDVTNISLDAPTRLVAINDVQVIDSTGKRVSQFKVGDTVDITSDLSIQYFALSGSKQDFIYYAQVKQFGETAPVEFLGFSEGTFSSGVPQTVSVRWTPENVGGFFIEAYVWDPNGVALAAPSKTISIVLITP